MEPCEGNLSSLVAAAEDVARGGASRDEAVSILTKEFSGMDIDHAMFRMLEMDRCRGQGFHISALTHISDDGQVIGKLERLTLALEPGSRKPVLDVIEDNGKEPYVRIP